MLFVIFFDSCWKFVVLEKVRKGKGFDFFYWVIEYVGDRVREGDLGLS